MKAYYQDFVKRKVDVPIGQALEVANKVLEPLDPDTFKYQLLKDDLMHQNMFYHKKLDVINMEFDGKIAALVAQLLFKQSIVESQKKDLLKKLAASRDNEEIRQLKKELQNRDGIFKVDDTMHFTADERKKLNDPKFQPNEYELRKRITRISMKALQFLKKLNVPNEAIFSNSKLSKAMRIRAEKVDDGNFLAMAQKNIQPNLKPVIVAGVAFYLDHDNQMAVPMDPLNHIPVRAPNPIRLRTEPDSPLKEIRSQTGVYA